MRYVGPAAEGGRPTNDRAASDYVPLPMWLLDWLVERAVLSLRNASATPTDHANLAAVRARKRSVAFERNDAGPLRPGWVTIQEAAEATGTPIRTLQAQCQNGQRDAHKLSGWLVRFDEKERRHGTQ